MLLAAFERADTADAAHASADAAAFTRATHARIVAAHAWHTRLQRAGLAAGATAVAGAAAIGDAFTPFAPAVNELAAAFGDALAMPATWLATVVLLLALRGIAAAALAD